MRRRVFIEDDPLLLDSDATLLAERGSARRGHYLGDDWEFRSFVEQPDVLETAWNRSVPDQVPD